MEELLQLYVTDGAAFSLWVAQYPELTESVYQSLVALHHLRGSITILDVHAMRDAAHNIHMIAWQGGFSCTSEVFYHHYKTLCLQLLPLQEA